MITPIQRYDNIVLHYYVDLNTQIDFVYHTIEKLFIHENEHVEQNLFSPNLWN